MQLIVFQNTVTCLKAYPTQTLLFSITHSQTHYPTQTHYLVPGYVCVCVCVCVCLRPSTVKASSVWIKWDTKQQINDVVLKTLDSSAGSLHRYFGIQKLTFQLAALSCSYTRSGRSHNVTSLRLAFRT